ncbi:MAG TPA: amidohydrolase [Nakamurella sp.]|nr:amidohydrolase [Nakamurella sp.]
MPPSPAIDIHQHLWPPELIDALRSRRRAPKMRGWTLILDGEPPYEVDPVDHDPVHRRELDQGRIVVGLSSPLGIEDLPPEEAAPLLTAWHDGAQRLRPAFDAWASVTNRDPDVGELRSRLAGGFVGLQVAADRLATPATLERTAAILRVCETAGKPVFVHPGPVPARPDRTAILPTWWAAVVDYPSQLQAAWWSWQAVGRRLLPDLRICFAAGAGLGPVHHERFLARGGHPLVTDRRTFSTPRPTPGRGWTASSGSWGSTRSSAAATARTAGPPTPTWARPPIMPCATPTRSASWKEHDHDCRPRDQRRRRHHPGAGGL